MENLTKIMSQLTEAQYWIYEMAGSERDEEHICAMISSIDLAIDILLELKSNQ